jgi:hypothetical protein
MLRPLVLASGTIRGWQVFCAGGPACLKISAALLFVISAAYSQSVTITGSVAAERKGLADAQVTLAPISAANGSDAAPVPVLATADKHGALSIPGVQPGQYKVCVSVPNDEVLDPCEWGPPVMLTVDAGKMATLDIILTRGITVGFLLDDSKGVVDTPFQHNSGTVCRIGVYSRDGNFHPARYVSSQGKQHSYELILPLNTDLKLWIEAVGLQVFDQKDKRVDRSGGITLRSANNNAHLVLRYRVAAP